MADSHPNLPYQDSGLTRQALGNGPFTMTAPELAYGLPIDSFAQAQESRQYKNKRQRELKKRE